MGTPEWDVDTRAVLLKAGWSALEGSKEGHRKREDIFLREVRGHSRGM